MAWALWASLRSSFWSGASVLMLTTQPLKAAIPRHRRGVGGDSLIAANFIAADVTRYWNAETYAAALPRPGPGGKPRWWPWSTWQSASAGCSLLAVTGSGCWPFNRRADCGSASAAGVAFGRGAAPRRCSGSTGGSSARTMALVAGAERVFLAAWLDDVGDEDARLGDEKCTDCFVSAAPPDTEPILGVRHFPCRSAAVRIPLLCRARRAAAPRVVHEATALVIGRCCPWRLWGCWLCSRCPRTPTTTTGGWFTGAVPVMGHGPFPWPTAIGRAAHLVGFLVVAYSSAQFCSLLFRSGFPGGLFRHPVAAQSSAAGHG